MAAKGAVRRRRVFYIPGYDPFPARRYRELYRREAARQAAISGYEIDVSKAGAGPEGWHVSATMDAARIESAVTVLTWSDIVRDSMTGGVMASYARLLRTAWIYIATGTLGRLFRLRKGPVIAALYPVLTLLLQAGLACLAGWWVFRLSLIAEPSLGGAAPLLGAGLALGAFLLCLHGFRVLDRRIFAHYLMADYAFSAMQRGAYPPALDARITDFADRIAAALGEDVDEVLVVGHSSGAHLAVSALARVLREGKRPESGPALGLLSLGQVVPMVSFLPEARQLRADLRLLSTATTLTWVDVSAPGDGCSFALCDPVAVSGVAPVPKRWPLVFSAQFSRSLSPGRWRALRWRFFRLHFQYLCAFDRPRDYDYFRITAGPLTLSRRYAGRKPSASLIDAARSKYTSMAA